MLSAGEAPKGAARSRLHVAWPGLTPIPSGKGRHLLHVEPDGDSDRKALRQAPGRLAPCRTPVSVSKRGPQDDRVVVFTAPPYA